jgi:hypothetical protein
MPITTPRATAAEIELRQLERPFSHLRIHKSPRPIAPEMLQEQLHSALVVRGEAGQFVLIDGDELVDATEQLYRDTVHVVVLELSEEAALAHCYRMQREGRRSALEEGWLVAELLNRGRPLPQIGMSLGRSTSWVSRRLGLARSLPEKATDAVRRGIVPPHGAMKSLLPLARANEKYCELLCDRIGNKPISSRQLEAICKALRTADAMLRDRILDAPWLFVEAKEAITPALPDGMAGELVRELNAARLALHRACDAATRAWTIDIGALSEMRVKRAFQRCVNAYESFERHMEEPHAI